MITITTLEQAKKITKSLFDFTKKEKYNLSKFRTFFANENGFNELQDAFEKENEKKRNFIRQQYISFFDDPRVTIEVAREIQEDEKKAKSFFDNNLKDHSGIKFPIKDEYELLTRCEEILIIFNEIEYFNIKNLFNALTKMSFEKNRIGYIYPDMGNYGNPELIMAVETMKLLKQNNTEFFERMVNYNNETDFCFDTAFYDLFHKVKILTQAMVWQQTSCGQFIFKNVTEKNQQIRKDFCNKKLKSLEVKSKNLKTLFS